MSLAGVLGAALSESVALGQSELYAKKDSLQQTMLATRARVEQ